MNDCVHPVLPILFIKVATATFISGITSTVKSSSTARPLMLSNSILKRFRLHPCMFSNTTEGEVSADFSAMLFAEPGSSWSSLFGTELSAFCKASASSSTEREISHLTYCYTFPGISRFYFLFLSFPFPRKEII